MYEGGHLGKMAVLVGAEHLGDGRAVHGPGAVTATLGR
jgi:hypothetical protein